MRHLGAEKSMDDGGRKKIRLSGIALRRVKLAICEVNSSR